MWWLAALVLFVLVLVFLKGFVHRFHSKKTEGLYIIVVGEIPQIEWLVRELCAYLRHRGRFCLFVVDRGGYEESFILQRLSSQYCFPLLNDLPVDAVNVLKLDADSTPRLLLKELAVLEKRITIQE